MNIEKVKEGLEHLRHLIQQPDDFMFTAKYLREHFGEVLAELEKPAIENARIIAIDISLGALDRAEYWEVIVPQVIQQYAEAFHDERCAECQKARLTD